MWYIPGSWWILDIQFVINNFSIYINLHFIDDCLIDNKNRSSTRVRDRCGEQKSSNIV